MSFPRYPKYKASDAEWLGDVPAHWEVKRLRQIGRLLKGGGGTKEDVVDAGLPCVRYGDLYTTFSFHITKPRGFIAPERATDYTPISFGDVLFAASGEKLAEIGKSAVNLLEVPAVCGGDVVILRPEIDVESRFLGYACDSPTAAMQKASMGRGTTVKHIYPDELRLILLALPPLPEQRAIAAFLDRETAKIDGLVAEQQRLIELLKEKRQAVISHAVTKGLDPKAQMKPSGVEWLRDVPAHWEVRRLVSDLDFVTSDATATAEHYTDSGALFLRIGNLTRDSIALDLSDVQRVAVPIGSEGERTRVVEGDVLFSITAFLGSVAVVPPELEPAYVSQHVALARLRTGRHSPRWVGYVALSSVGNTWFQLQSYGGTKVQLSLDDIRSLPIPCPPLEEQERVLWRLDTTLASLASLVREAESAIALLQERRSALISAAVTGQIDVRNAVATEAA